LANILGISQSQYSKLENGEVIFDVQKLGLLMDQLNINPLDVIEFSDKQQLFIQSAMSSNHNNNSFNNYDEEKIRKIVQEELGKNDTKE
jgi:transcriptional regulator with XRE-family HTH domain